jgi:hypothetical protein
MNLEGLCEVLMIAAGVYTINENMISEAFKDVVRCIEQTGVCRDQLKAVLWRCKLML